MNYISVKEYADMQGVTTSAIHLRIKRGRLEFVTLNGLKLVDASSYKKGVSGRPKTKQNEEN